MKLLSLGNTNGCSLMLTVENGTPLVLKMSRYSDSVYDLFLFNYFVTVLDESFGKFVIY